MRLSKVFNVHTLKQDMHLRVNPNLDYTLWGVYVVHARRRILFCVA
jgi:hypothetical protein